MSVAEWVAVYFAGAVVMTGVLAYVVDRADPGTDSAPRSAIAFRVAALALLWPGTLPLAALAYKFPALRRWILDGDA